VAGSPKKEKSKVVPIEGNLYGKRQSSQKSDTVQEEKNYERERERE
jgi:hypothetical protein